MAQRKKSHTNSKKVDSTYSQTLTGNSQTILSHKDSVHVDAGGGSRTGIIIEAGTEDGEVLKVLNISDQAENITFATDATSNVAGGTAIVIGQNEKRTFSWDETRERWIPESTDTATQNSLSSSTHYVFSAGQHTTAGGDTSESATVTGALATDIAIASIEDNGTNNVTLLQTAAASNAVNFTMSADPGADCIINYVVYRAV